MFSRSARLNAGFAHVKVMAVVIGAAAVAAALVPISAGPQAYGEASGTVGKGAVTVRRPQGSPGKRVAPKPGPMTAYMHTHPGPACPNSNESPKGSSCNPYPNGYCFCIHSGL